MATLCVLLVEDIAAVGGPVAEALADAGFEVSVAESAGRALDLMERLSFDVLVTDIHLDTSFGGLDVARSWRSRFPGRPLVFASAYPRSAVDIGPMGERDGYLQKPYRPSDLMGVINFVLGRVGSGPASA